MRGFAHLSFFPFDIKSWEETFEYNHSEINHSLEHHSDSQYTHYSSPKYFVGHFINLTDYKNYGIKATLSPTPPPPSHNFHSCLLEHPIYYDLTIQDYTTNRRWTLKWAGWWGGDAGWMSSDPNCSANGDKIMMDERHGENISTEQEKKLEQYIWFRTNRLKANEEAKKHIKKFFPRLEIDEDDLNSAHVCLGEMVIVVENEREIDEDCKGSCNHGGDDELREESEKEIGDEDEIGEADNISEEDQVEDFASGREDEEYYSENEEMAIFSEEELEKICNRFS
ncbi:16093_t:CDS:1 [Acaulospora colombiana]|uniref:16093_t:CDS:1 n=1 Tax=Acaulospora colombiana TaxID=27376 RepID=A0ACA9L2R9_9GLOM|nr:16093_t:CDS:1 [Acaulospora colombiana]